MSNALVHVPGQGDAVEVVGLHTAGDGGRAIQWDAIERALAGIALKSANAWSVPDGVTLEALADEWLDAMSGQLDTETRRLYRLHLSTHLIPHFRSPQHITKAGIAEYGRQRLRVVKRATVQKERSTLRGFLAWCQEQGYLAEQPEFAVLARRAMGTAFRTRRRGKATELTPEECSALIAALPEFAVSKKTGRFAVRARFQLMYETALRPATLDALSVPEHFSRGSDTLRIADEDDKARFGRNVPLSAAARAALESVSGKTGLIFGEHDYRFSLERAARAVLPATKARTFCAYDLRHARLTELAEGGNLTGTAYLAGHKRVTTTAIYVKPGLRAAERALGSSIAPQRNGPGIARGVVELTGAALRALPPPESPEQAMAEWQVVINALADLRENAAQASKAELAPKRRATSPREPVAFDDAVETAIDSGHFSSQLHLRAVVGCSLRRLKGALVRLVRAGRIVKDGDPAHWRVVSPDAGARVSGSPLLQAGS